MSEAPDIKAGYPSCGATIGPLWQDMWDEMARGEWVTVTQLYDRFREYEVQRQTVYTLLHGAAKAGLLEQKREQRAPKRRFYRRPESSMPKPLTREFLQQQWERSRAQSAEATRRYEAAVKEEQEFLAMIQAIKARDAAGGTPLDTPDQGV